MTIAQTTDDAEHARREMDSANIRADFAEKESKAAEERVRGEGLVLFLSLIFFWISELRVEGGAEAVEGAGGADGRRGVDGRSH